MVIGSIAQIVAVGSGPSSGGCADGNPGNSLAADIINPGKRIVEISFTPSIPARNGRLVCALSICTGSPFRSGRALRPLISTLSLCTARNSEVKYGIIRRSRIANACFCSRFSGCYSTYFNGCGFSGSAILAVNAIFTGRALYPLNPRFSLGARNSLGTSLTDNTAKIQCRHKSYSFHASKHNSPFSFM